jgi:hypothetical protein
MLCPYNRHARTPPITPRRRITPPASATRHGDMTLHTACSDTAT